MKKTYLFAIPLLVLMSGCAQTSTDNSTQLNTLSQTVDALSQKVEDLTSRVTALEPKQKTAQVSWITYQSNMYSFSFKYPSSLTIDPVDGTNADKKVFRTISIATPEYLKQLKAVPEGTAGLPVYLEISAVKQDTVKDCGQFMTDGTMSIDSVTVPKCVGKDEAGNSVPDEIMISFTKDNVNYFTIQSGMYDGENKNTIDQILATFKFL